MDTVVEGIALFAALLVAFGVVAAFGGVVEYFLHLRDVHRRNRRHRREVLPDPHPRTVVRRRGWNVPL